MDTISFTVWGNPKAQQRHRTYTKGKGGRPLPFAKNVDPSKDDKADFLAQIMQHRPGAPWDTSVAVELLFVVPHPKSHFRTGKRAGELRDGIPYMCGKKPDIDNYIKLVLDAMSGIFFLDDAQVVTIEARKRYDHLPERPRTEVVLRKLQI